jgi:HAD superfamily hydrolase (TIGR01509 family)
MKKLYIFDMGGVVSRNNDVTALIADHLGLAERRLYELARDDFQELTTGAITVEMFWKRFSEASGTEVEEDLLARFFHPEPDREVLDIIGRLRGRARVVVGTNTIEPHYRAHLSRGDYEVFDAVYASNRMGLAKPDPAFYTFILQREGCEGREAVFVDDMEVNVEAAAELGIEAFLFDGAAKLAEELALPS